MGSLYRIWETNACDSLNKQAPSPRQGLQTTGLKILWNDLALVGLAMPHLAHGWGQGLYPSSLMPNSLGSFMPML